MNPTIENLLTTHRRGRRSLHQVLLELHVLHTKLGTLIMEVERSLDPLDEPCEPAGEATEHPETHEP